MSIEDDRIEHLKRKLYSRNEEPVLDVRSPISAADDRNGNNSSQTWGDSSLHIPDDMATNRTHPILKKFLFAAGLFFIIALGVAAYVFFGGNNFVSASNVNITVAGPSSIGSGQAVDLSVSVVNQNSSDLQFATLTVDYPDGTKSSSDATTPLSHDVQDLGTIAKGSSVDRSISAYFFGDKGVTRTVKLTLSYKLAGSNAVFTKQKTYDLQIASSPVIVQVSGPTQVNSGQQVTFTGTVTSNSSTVLKGIVLQVDYPYGFTYQTSSMPTTAGKQNVWKLGDIKSGDQKTFSITGTLAAQDGEQRTFQFTVGTASADPTKNIDTLLSQASQTITVSKPFIAANFELANSTADTVAVNGGDGVSGSINFTNTLPDQINNVAVVASVSGTALDRASVQADQNGFYQSTDGSVTWNKNSNQAFATLAPGDSQNVSFSFNTLRLSSGAKNPSVNVTLAITASHQASDGSTAGDNSNVTINVARTVKVNANLVMIARTLRNGPITNSGPVPPRAEQASTYTIDWALTNTWNDVSGAKVTAVLPAGVEWTGNVSPSTAPITYNADSRTVTWNPDAVSAGAGFSLSPKEAFFQVKVTPSLSQVGGVVQLISAAQVTAHDTFTGATLNLVGAALTTQTADTGSAGIVTR